jgi:DNA repair photolyase
VGDPVQLESVVKAGPKPRYYTSPRWTHEIADCSMPMTFDQDSRCSYGCLYCFAAFQKGVGESKKAYLAGNVRSVDVSRVMDFFIHPHTKAQKQFSQYIAERRVMQWGGMADPFCEYERRYGRGLELLRFFRDIDYPLSFSTKGTWWTKDKRYTELFKDNPNWHVKVSIVTGDVTRSKLVEPGVDTPNQRLNAIERLANLNCAGVTLRLRPFLIGITDPSHVGLVRRAARAGAISVSTEFFCCERRSAPLKKKLRLMSRIAGFDYLQFYIKNSHGTGYLRLSRAVKRPYVESLGAACKKAKIPLFISDAHFKERCPAGSCCGLPESMNYCRGQFTQALVIARTNGRVRWADIEKDLAYAKTFMWRSAEGYNTIRSSYRAAFWRHTMYDYLRWVWDNPASAQSPYTMYEGILRPAGRDKEGHLIYEYDASRA